MTKYEYQVIESDNCEDLEAKLAAFTDWEIAGMAGTTVISHAEKIDPPKWCVIMKKPQAGRGTFTRRPIGGV